MTFAISINFGWIECRGSKTFTKNKIDRDVAKAKKNRTLKSILRAGFELQVNICWKITLKKWAKAVGESGVIYVQFRWARIRYTGYIYMANFTCFIERNDDILIEKISNRNILNCTENALNSMDGIWTVKSNSIDWIDQHRKSKRKKKWHHKNVQTIYSFNVTFQINE